MKVAATRRKDSSCVRRCEQVGYINAGVESMSSMVWDETDIALVFEALPEIYDNGVSYKYSAERDGMCLEVLVYPYDGDITINLYREGLEQPVFQAGLNDCAGVRRVRGKNGEYLEFAPGVAPDRRYDGVPSMRSGVRLYVNPSISISLFE